MKLPQPNLPLVYMCRSLESATRVPQAGRFRGGWDMLRDIGLVTVDVDNLVTAYRSLQVYSGVFRAFDAIRDRGTNICLATNNTDGEHVGKIAKKLDVPFLYKGQVLENGIVVPSKMHPGMYATAISTVGFGNNGDKAMHFDDQIKNYMGMRQVEEFTQYGWTFPRDHFHAHIGTQLFRIPEFPLVVAAHVLSHDDSR